MKSFKTRSAGLNCLLMILSFTFSGCSSHKLPGLVIETELGKIVIVADTIRAPVTAGNFLNLAANHVFDGASFYRVVRIDNQSGKKEKIEVIQGGLFEDSLVMKHPTIIHETTRITGIFHLDGTISMARNEPGTASTEFFICIGNQPSLDFGGQRNPDGQGFAAFGRVVKGMDIVRKIQQKTDTAQYLINPIIIVQITCEK